jgi:hypothetical protein
MGRGPRRRASRRDRSGERIGVTEILGDATSYPVMAATMPVSSLSGRPDHPIAA